jgi:hypothetical protein
MECHTRRSFLRHAALAGAGLTILAGPRARTYAANAKLNVALIGVGGRGKWYVDVIPKQATVVAFCDVNESKATAAYKEHPDTPKFHDFREMLDKQKEIEGVIVATPDHTHAVAAATAMKAGKHAFVEKPLAGCVYEARVMRELAAKHKVASQMGNQGSASGAFRRGIELVEDGVFGNIKDVIVWNTGGGADKKDPPKEAQTVPPYLTWDLWLGPIKDRPFHASWLGWSQWREFGTGQIGMWSSHSGYLAFVALNVASLWKADPAAKLRIRVAAGKSGINRLSFPKWEVVRFLIPARPLAPAGRGQGEGATLPPVTITWVNGTGGGAELWTKINDSIAELAFDEEKKKLKQFAGALFIGDKGRLFAGGHNSDTCLLPSKQFEGVNAAKPERITKSHGMPEPDWLRAARGDDWLTMSGFAVAGPYMEMMLLANVATQFDAELEYDPLDGKIVNHADADAALRREYRAGWSL